MMKNEITLIGVDEFNITLLPNMPVSALSGEWSLLALSIISEFAKKAKFQNVLQSVLCEMPRNKPSGYDCGFEFVDKPYLFTVAFHSDNPAMGVSVAFHAHAWADYQKEYKAVYGEPINIASFMDMIQSDLYLTRLSRVDFTVDYFDWKLSLKGLYSGITEGTYSVIDKRGQSHIKKYSAFFESNQPGTIYIGSKKGNTRGFARIYDKKREQIAKDGFRKLEAMQHESWVRFEASFRGKAAHNISEAILNEIEDEEELKLLIITAITNKYRLHDMQNEEFLPITQVLLDELEGCNSIDLRTEDPRDYGLEKNIGYIRKGSGLYSTLFKVEQVYGENAHLELLQLYESEYQIEKEGLRDNKEIKAWLRRHRKTCADSLDAYFE